MNKWQPIATAPKDGTRILLAMGSEQVVASWDEGDQEWVYAVTDIEKDPGLFYCSYARGATHWMSLPDAPPEGRPA